MVQNIAQLFDKHFSMINCAEEKETVSGLYVSESKITSVLAL